MPRLELHPFDPGHVDDAAALLARRHAAQRVVEPSLPAAYEQAAAAREEIVKLLTPEASGAVATRGGTVVGYVVGTPRGNQVWGPNTWIEAAGHAAAEPEAIRDLYAAAATRWVEERRTAHYAIVPAGDHAAVDAWFRLGFGHQHVHAVREVPQVVEPLLLPGVTVRPATRDDVDALAALDAVLPRHQALSPCFSAGEAPPPLAVAREEWLEMLDGAVVAELDGRIVGSGYFCPVDLSSAHSGVARPPGAALLAYAAVEPEARGAGIGQAVARAALGWARRSDRDVIVTDWRMTNLLSSRAWPRAGYRPAFYRLFRAIA
jgi:GNAT superfamily N-acetyltransferase